MVLDKLGRTRTGLRNFVFSIITICSFFILLEVVLALSDIQPLLVSEDPYVGFSKLIPLFVEQQDNGRQVFNTAKNKLKFFNPQSFPREKGSNSYRIFCMGGSTTYGRPYDYRTSFCGWLEAFLNAAEPVRDWQVINAGGISYASYRVTALMEELANYQPDLFIIYSGHNEFLEERTYQDIIKLPGLLTETSALLANSRIYTLIKNVVTEFNPPPYELKEEVDERLAHSVGPQDYHRNDKLRAEIVTHYRINIRRMKEVADAAGSRIIFTTPARNLRDQRPFKSEHDTSLSKDQLAQWQLMYKQGKDLLSLNSPQKALKRFDQAASLDDRYAELHYLRGKALFAMERYTEARSSFERAADEDIAPLRILTEVQTILTEVVSGLKVPLINFDQLLKDHNLNSEGHNITGREWFLDHVHPTIEGHRELALAIYQQLLSDDIVKPKVDLDARHIAQISDSIGGLITPERERTALHNLAQVLGWAGQLEEAHSILLRLLEHYGEDDAVLIMLGRSSERLGNTQESISFYERAVALNPASNEARVYLARKLREQGRIQEAIVHFTASVKIAPTFKYSLYSLAELLTEKGETGQSINVYRQLLAQFPKDELATIKLGILLLYEGGLTEAEKLFTDLCDEKITISDACMGLAQISERKGDLQEAARWYNKAIEHGQGNAKIHNSLAIVLRNLGQLDQAISHFRKAVQIKPEYKEAQQNLATALREKQR
jgi:tetratricopeptide (TPR) repeat protein